MKDFSRISLTVSHFADYRFLEEVGRSIDTKKRNPEIKFTRQANLPVVRYLRVFTLRFHFKTCHVKSAAKLYIKRYSFFQHLHKLRCAAAYKKVSLLFMPQIFSRHKKNTTYLNWKTNELFWRLEWIFPQAENIKCIVDRCGQIYLPFLKA